MTRNPFLAPFVQRRIRAEHQLLLTDSIPSYDSYMQSAGSVARWARAYLGSVLVTAFAVAAIVGAWRVPDGNSFNDVLDTIAAALAGGAAVRVVDDARREGDRRELEQRENLKDLDEVRRLSLVLLSSKSFGYKGNVSEAIANLVNAIRRRSDLLDEPMSVDELFQRLNAAALAGIDALEIRDSVQWIIDLVARIDTLTGVANPMPVVRSEN